MTTETDTHPSWCDPRTCEVDSALVGGRQHHVQREDVTLSLHDRDNDYAQFVAVVVTQSTRDAEPTLGLYSETVGNNAGTGDGFDARFTRQEFIALHAEMGRMIEASA